MRVFEYDPVINPKKYYCCFDAANLQGVAEGRRPRN